MSRTRSIVIAFGRFNPPTTGHASLLSFIETTAHRYRADIRVYPSQSQDAKKNPLPFQEKLRFLKTLFPHILFNTNTAIRTPFDALADVAAAGYTDVILVVGSDRVEEFSRFKKYIVPRSDPHFNKAQHIPLNSYQVIAVPTIRGGTGVAGMSASKQRAFAAAGDYDSFKQGVPGQNDRVARDLYTTVRRHMQIKETTQFRINTKIFRLPLLEAMDTFAVMAIGDASPSHKHGGYGHTPDTKVLWQMFDLAKHEVKLAAQEARRKYPTATISVENKNGKIVKVYKPGQQITETIHEARLGMPLKGHAYHKKTDAELRYIIKDAGEAARAMQGRNSTAEGKYLDQVDDAHTVLYYRRQGGKQMKESQLREDHIRVGDRVHAGLATKGGHGFKGIVDRVEGNFVYVNIGTDKFGDRIIKAPMRTVMKEATSLFGKNGAWGPAVGKAVSKWGNSRFTEAELEKVWTLANKYPNDAKREYALRCVDELKGLGRAKFKDADSLSSVKIPSGLSPMVAKGIRNNLEDALNESAGARRCDCEHEKCHPNGNCSTTGTEKTTTYGMTQMLCKSCQGKTKLKENTGAVGKPKAPSETDRLKISQKQDEISLKQRQSTAMMAAKLRDIQSTARDQQAKANAPKGN